MDRAARAASSCSTLTRPGADLDPDRQALDLDLVEGPGARPPLHALAPDPERAGGLGEHRGDLRGQ